MPLLYTFKSADIRLHSESLFGGFLESKSGHNYPDDVTCFSESQGWAYLVTILRNLLRKSMPPRKKTLPCGAGPPLQPPIPSGEKHTETVKLEPVAGRLLYDPGNNICWDKIKLSLFTALDTRGLLQAALVVNG